MAGDTDGETALYSSSVFEYQNRPRRDSGWSIAYLVFAVATAVIGVVGIAKR